MTSIIPDASKVCNSLNVDLQKQKSTAWTEQREATMAVTNGSKVFTNVFKVPHLSPRELKPLRL